MDMNLSNGKPSDHLLSIRLMTVDGQGATVLIHEVTQDVWVEVHNPRLMRMAYEQDQIQLFEDMPSVFIAKKDYMEYVRNDIEMVAQDERSDIEDPEEIFEDIKENLNRCVREAISQRLN